MTKRKNSMNIKMNQNNMLLGLIILVALVATGILPLIIDIIFGIVGLILGLTAGFIGLGIGLFAGAVGLIIGLFAGFIGLVVGLAPIILPIVFVVVVVKAINGNKVSKRKNDFDYA